MKLECSSLRIDGQLRTQWDALLRVVGVFVLKMGDHVWYEEDEFCVLEFGRSLATWLEHINAEQSDMNYTSLESDAPELLRIAQAGAGKWRLFSPAAKFPADVVVSTQEIQSAASGFFHAVWKHLPRRRSVLELLASSDLNQDLVRRLKACDLARPDDSN